MQGVASSPFTESDCFYNVSFLNLFLTHIFVFVKHFVTLGFVTQTAVSIY